MSQTVVVVLFVAGLAASYLLALRSTKDRWLLRLVVVAYLTRVLLAIALYGISSWDLPIARGLHVEHGFWSFAPDAAYYDRYAKPAAVALAAGLELPFVYGVPDYPLLVTFIYRLCGPQPLCAIALNIWLASMTVVVSYALARTVWSVNRSRAVAAVIAFWPSSLLWSTQLLKDALASFLIVGFLLAFQRLVERIGERDGYGAQTRILGVAFAGLFVLYRLRYYVGLTILAASLLVLLVVAIRAAVETRYARAAGAVVTSVCLVLALWAATTVTPTGLGKPVDRLQAHRRLAAHMVSIGDVAGALEQLQAAHAGPKQAPRDPDDVDRLARAELRQLLVDRGRLPADRGPDATLHSGPPVPRMRLDAFEEATRRLEKFNLSTVASLRQFMLTRPGSLVSGDPLSPTDLTSLIRLAPLAIGNALLTPHPWTRFQGEGTGIFRALAMIEVALVLALLWSSASGFCAMFQRDWRLALTILLFAALLAAGLGYAVPSVGILFRLRLAIIIPLCVVAGGATAPAVVIRAWQRLRGVPAARPHRSVPA